MERSLRTRRTGLLAAVILSAAIMCITGLSGGVKAYAASRRITLCVWADRGIWSRPVVYYGDLEWYLSGYRERGYCTGFAGEKNSLTLFAKNNIGLTYFRDPKSRVEKDIYRGSSLQSELDHRVGAFYPAEQDAIMKRTLPSGEYAGKETDGIKGDAVTGARLWPLSIADTRRLNNYNSLPASADWWLRSPGKKQGSISMVSSSGEIVEEGTDPAGAQKGIRPGVFLSTKNIVMLSSVDQGKQSGKPGPGALKKVGSTGSNVWKLTLTDKNREKINVTSAEWSDKGLLIKYTGNLVKSDNNYISAMLVTRKSIISYYGRIMKTADANGEFCIDLNGKTAYGDTLYVFQEQINGSKESDFASPLTRVAIPKTASGGDEEVKIQKVVLQKAKKTGSRKVKLSWKRVSGCRGYEIRYSTSKKFKSGVKKKTVNGFAKTNITLGGLKKGKTYYFKVRAFSKDAAGKVYGKWSNVKKVRLK